MTTREQALTEITALAREHNISIDDIAARLIADDGKTPTGQARMLTRLLSYVGGLLVFCGLGFFIAQQWDALDSLSRVLITFGPGFVALLLAVACLRDARYERAATPLFIIAAILQPLGLFVFLGEYFGGGDPATGAMIITAPMAVQMTALLYRLRRTALAFFSIGFWFLFLCAVMEKMDIDGDIVATVLGLSGLMVTAAVNRTAFRAFVPFTYILFAACFAGGLFSLLVDTRGDVLLLGAAYLMIFASVRAHSRALLFAGVITAFAYLCYFTDRYFADTVGWPVALIALGLIMLGLSAYALRLGNKIKQA